MNEFTELLKRLEKHALGGATFAKYLASWKWPKGYASGRNVCSAAEGSMDYSPRGSASEMLSVVPVLEKFILDVAMPKMVCVSELQSALLLIKVVGFLNQTHVSSVTPRTLESAIVAHLTEHQRAYGVLLWKPKNHFVLHLPGQLARHGSLLATFVMERKHKVVKRMASSRHNTTGYEQGMLEDITLQHLHDLQSPLARVGLQSARPASEKLKQAIAECMSTVFTDYIFFICNTGIVNFRALCMGDVVAFQSDSTTAMVSHTYHHGIPWRRNHMPSHVKRRMWPSSWLRSVC